jgi:hypothetical protein
MATAGMVIALYMGKVPIAPENHAAFLAAFRTASLIFAGLCLAGIFASMARGRLRTEGGWVR